MLNEQFLLDPSITFLNHGSFGACPQIVFDDYQRWQRELEREPVQFMVVNGPRYLQQSRETLGQYIGCHADEVVYTPNPTYAINIIAKSLSLSPGDEILTTDLEYGAMDRTWNYYCRKAGAKYVQQHIPLPVSSKEAFIEAFWKGYTKNTRVVFISHITSATALILPVHEICAMARERGLLTIVDGAHVPGHIPLDLRTLDVDLYTGACHKWLLTPKGCSFLYAKPSHQQFLDPLVVSWGYESIAPSHSQFLDYHEMQGTRDFSAFLAVPAAVRFLEENNWSQVSAACRKLVQENYERVCAVLGTQPICPNNEIFLGQMCSSPVRTTRAKELQRLLYERYRIEIPVMIHGEYTFLRFSIQAYNSQQDIDRLLDALQEIRKEGGYFEA